MTTRQVDMPELTEEQIRIHRAGEALHRDGANPSGSLELLAAIVADRTWERVSDAKGVPFTGRFRAFVEARPPFGLGYSVDELPKVIQLRHPHESVQGIAERMAGMRSAVEMLLRDEIPAAASVGFNQHTKRGESATLPSSKARDAGAVVARLKRDDPALAEKVVRGDLTANAAAREKGWRKPRIVVSSPESVARSLRQLMDADDLARLVVLLMGGGA